MASAGAVNSAAKSASDSAMDPVALASLADEVLDWRFKGLPDAAWGSTVREYLATRPRLTDFCTPLLTLDAKALGANLGTMAAYCEASGVALAPHGKTTMAPALWARQLDAGAWGITLANPAQLRVARAFGVRRLQLANALVDPAALRWVSAELDADPAFEFVCWADSRRGVELMDEALRVRDAQRPVDVFVELGASGGRTGARSLDEAVEIAQAVSASSTLRLIGVAGYEGALARGSTARSLAAVEEYLQGIGKLHEALLASELYEAGTQIWLTAGGSSYFDQVVDVLGPFSGQNIKVMLRSGAYLVHDDGYYHGISPFTRRIGMPLVSAMHGWARVLSRPEPALALLDGGKRDFPFDEGLPTPQSIRGKQDALIADASVSAIADQHTFVQLDSRSMLEVGDVVRLGLSHPCTALDKWTLIPVIDGASADDPLVVDLVRTFF